MVHRVGDLFNPPALTNHRGCAQVGCDITAIQHVSFPPLASGEHHPEAFGLIPDNTGALYLDGHWVAARGIPVELVWQADRIERSTRVDGLALRSTTIVPPEGSAVMVRLVVTNEREDPRSTEIKLGLRSSVTHHPGPWLEAPSPGEPGNAPHVGSGIVAFAATRTAAFAVHGGWPEPAASPSWLVWTLDLAPGASSEITYTVVLGRDVDAATGECRRLLRRFDDEAESSQRRWDKLLRDAFTPGNDEFSGHLPLLVTDDERLRRLFHTAALGALVHRRHLAAGPVYITLSPRWWQAGSFMWDTSLASSLLSMLDPAVLRDMIERWMATDYGACFGNDGLTRKPMGPWPYAVNHFALVRMADNYLRWSGDFDWLDAEVGDRSVLDQLVAAADHWRTLDVNGHGLADYGGMANLLEAVSTYVHEVAGLNAASVWSLRTVAAMLEGRGRREEAARLRGDADSLLGAVLDLYVDGTGRWACRLPDGTLQDVGHAYDFGTVLTTIGGDLDDARKKEMVRFFDEELRTPTWMRALSTADLDATIGVRPDHQWTGAYAAWPAIALSALYAAGEHELAGEWTQGIALTTGQGPIGQAHFADAVVAPSAGGGAQKAPNGDAYMMDWSCLSGAGFLEPICEGRFGLRAVGREPLSAQPSAAAFAEATRLVHVPHQGRLYTLSAAGLEPEPESP